MTESGFQRELGRTGLHVSALGLGTVKFGRNTDVNYPGNFSIPDDRSLYRLLDVAQSLGINLIDTAPAYGNSESRLGKLLKSSRDYWCLCTKVGELYQHGKSRFDFSTRSIRESVTSSLRNLGTDVLDLVLVHSDGNDEAIVRQTDALQTLQVLKDAGTIRSFGMSTKTVAGGLLALDLVDVLMVTLNETDQSQSELIIKAANKQKGVLIKKALESGHTSNSGRALRFATNFPGVTSVVIGTINPDHLKENAASLSYLRN